MISDKFYRSAVDTFNGRFINGWCFHRFFKNRQLTIKIVGDGQVIGQTSTEHYRKDMKKLKLHPTGLCGFDYSFSADFDPQQYRLLEVIVEGCSRPLFSLAGAEVEQLSADPEQRVCFMHIPKTAGSSFNSFLRRCYAADDFASHLEREQKSSRQSAVETKRCVSGHLPWSELASVTAGGGFRYYSIVRDPFHHLHSHINYVRRVFTDREDEEYYEYQHNETIKILGEKLLAIDFTNHHQTRSFVDTLHGYECDFFDNIQTRYFLDYRPERVTLSDFQNAQETMRKFSRVGLTEKYDQFVECFCQDLDVPFQTTLQQSNISDQYHLFSETEVAEDRPLHELVKFDFLLYQHVSDLFLH